MSASQTEAWTRMGGDYHISPVYTDYFDKGTENLEIDVTPLVEEWIAGTKDNYGFGVHLTGTQEAYFAEYYPREAVYFDKLAWLSGSGTDVSSSSGKDTLSAWIYPSEATEMTICSWVRTSTTNLGSSKYFRIIGASGRIIFHQAYGGPGAVNMAITTVAGVPMNTWSHVAASHNYFEPDGSDSVIYINGISQSCTVVPGTDGGSPWAMADFMVGTSRTNATPHIPLVPWSGYIDDVSYFNRILTSDEMLEIYNGGCPNDLKSLTASSASLQHWWI
ncbi:MAG TPA: LamG domain-containing protein, partial [Chromatiaceae bacterium]|nr:LamG domain-containing protein [Chromatiaceae bacterium]